MGTGTASTAGRNAAATGVATTHLSLHTANPGDSGANEVTGGGYARKAVTFGAAAGGVRTATGSPVAAFDGPASQAVTHFGHWTAATGGTFLGAVALASGSDDLAFNAAGKYNVTAATITATSTP